MDRARFTAKFKNLRSQKTQITRSSHRCCCRFSTIRDHRYKLQRKEGFQLFEERCRVFALFRRFIRRSPNPRFENALSVYLTVLVTCGLTGEERS